MTGHTKTIAHILPWSSVGGTEHATLRVAQAVAPRYRSKIFCLPEAESVAQMFSDEGFETVTYQPITPSYRHAWAFLRDSYKLAQDFKRHQIEVVHCADVLAGYYAAVAGRLAGLPVLCHVRSRHADLTRRDVSFLRAVNRFIFVSEDTRRRSAVRVPDRRAEIVHDGISISTFDARAANEARAAVLEEFGLPKRTRLVGMVARVAPQKDYETLAKAAARIAPDHPDVRFVIVGDNSIEAVHREHYQNVKALLTQLGIESRFLFTGFRADVSKFVAALDVFVLSTHLEGFPLVILEALAHGKPVIATAVDGIPEIIVDDVTGFLFPPQNDLALATRITAVLQSEGLARRLSTAGRESVERNFSRERFAANMIDLYDRVIEERSQSTATREPRANFRTPKTMPSE